MLTQSAICKRLLGIPVALCALLTVQDARADLMVTPTVTPMGGFFRYDYTITNDLPAPGEDVLLVDIHVLPMDATLTNLFAPAGFQSVYDSGLGIVSFLPELASFDLFAVGTSISGFGFDSSRSPLASTFDAFTINANIFSGPTLAPIGAAVPEPGTLTLLVVGVATMLVGRRHIRTSCSSTSATTTTRSA